MKTGKAILYGALIWVIMFVLWSIMMFAPGIKDMQVLQYIVGYVVLIVAVFLLAKKYYKSKSKANGFLLGLIFAVVGIILDAIVTVPLFIMPEGMGYADFFLNIWMIVGYALMILVAGLYDQLRN